MPHAAEAEDVAKSEAVDLEQLFAPHTIAVVGASRTPGSVASSARSSDSSKCSGSPRSTPRRT